MGRLLGMELTESRCCEAGRDISYRRSRLEMQVQAGWQTSKQAGCQHGVIGSGDRHTFEAVMFVIVCVRCAVVNGPAVVV